jgi:alcohol dehydrogenase
MHALVFTMPGVMEVQHVSRPRAADGEVLVSVRAAGICGSELHGFRAAGFRAPPLIMGHELAGETADGRRVVVNPLISCGTCDLCGRGRPQLCRTRQLVGVHRDGGFAEQVAVPETAVHELPAGMSWESAVLAEPLANAVHAWGQVRPEPDARVAVIGAGAIGLVCLLIALDRGLGDVTVVDRSPGRLALATRLGATRCAPDLEGEYDIVIDAVGAAATRRLAVERLRPGGASVWLGLAGEDPGFDGNGLVRAEKRVVGSFAYRPEDFAHALQRAPQLELAWASPIAFEDAHRTFMELADGAADPVKAVIRF